jgi:hypothetical protein
VTNYPRFVDVIFVGHRCGILWTGSVRHKHSVRPRFGGEVVKESELTKVREGNDRMAVTITGDTCRYV